MDVQRSHLLRVCQDSRRSNLQRSLVRLRQQVRSQSGAAATSRLRTEAQLHALVGGHPHVVRYHFAWPDGSGGINVLMERCDEELWEFRLQAEGVRLTDNARWGSQIAAG